MDRATELTRRRYNRISGLYDVMDRMMGDKEDEWRLGLLSTIEGQDILEVGVGTGRNLALYPDGLRVTAIDFSSGMLQRAQARLQRLKRTNIQLVEADVQRLPFDAHSFDTAVTSCVFCSVPDPVRGLEEIHRVLRPSGKLVMLEHVLSCKPVLRQAMRAANPLVRSIVGANINRQTRINLERAGFHIIEEHNLWLDIMKLFVASPGRW